MRKLTWSVTTACLVLVLTALGSQAVPAFASSDTLSPGQSLSAGRALWSSNGQYEAIMQTDGNFVLYGPHGALWSSNTYGGQSNRVAVMQTDGNFVIYGPSGALWAANTTDIAGVSLVVQNDSNLVLYAAGGIPVWDRHSGLVGSGKAIGWAKNYLGTATDPGLCLTFVYNAWLSAGVNIGTSNTALSYWNSNPRHYQKNTSQSPPAGTLVFWGANAWSSDGHVAISLGGGKVISTAAYPYAGENPNNPDVFIFSLSQRNPTTYHYLGWMMP